MEVKKVNDNIFVENKGSNKFQLQSNCESQLLHLSIVNEEQSIKNRDHAAIKQVVFKARERVAPLRHDPSRN